MGFSSGTSTRWLYVHCFQVELEFGVLVFAEGGKLENLEKNARSRNENQQQTQPTCDARSGNRTRATAVRGERSQHSAIPKHIIKQEQIIRCYNLHSDSPKIFQCPVLVDLVGTVFYINFEISCGLSIEMFRTLVSVPKQNSFQMVEINIVLLRFSITREL